jgi:hypothetical protein
VRSRGAGDGPVRTLEENAMDTNSVTPKSLQEILDHTVDYLCTQHCAAMGPDGGCAYRTPDGNCCAVGFWIPPALYRPEWDTFGPCGASVAFLIHDATEGAPFAAALAERGIDVHAAHVIKLLAMLQDAHDQSRHLLYGDNEGKTHHFHTRPAFFDAYIPYLLQHYRIPALSYAPRSPSVP